MEASVMGYLAGPYLHSLLLLLLWTIDDFGKTMSFCSTAMRLAGVSVSALI